MSSSICLVSQTEDSRLNINPDALTLIESLKGKISIVSMVGKYREGKSFLLSHLLRDLTSPNQSGSCLNTFKVDHRTKGFTKGLWMNANVKKINVKSEQEPVNLIMIDSEVKSLLN